MQDEAMYDDARMSKLKELKKLMMELALQDENGALKADELQAALDQAGDSAEAPDEESTETAAEAAAEAADPSQEVAEAAPEEEDPLAVARRKFFKPKREESTRRPGTAILMAALEKPKSPAEAVRKSFTKGRAS